MRYRTVLTSLTFMCTIAACHNEEPAPQAEEKFCLEDSFKETITFDTATRKPISEGIHLVGTIEANPDKVVSIRSLFSGVVTSTNFSLGDRVQKGQVLAEVSSTEYSALNAELQSVEAQIKVAETKLRSVKAMFSDGVASQKDLDEAQSELDILIAEKEKVTSNRNLYSASNTKNAFLIKAPATGIVTLKAISQGMQISGDSEEPLFTIANLNDVWVMASIYASNVRYIHEGMPVDISTMSYPEKIFKGKISAISQTLDESKVLKARIVLDNPDLLLKPGMLADITALKKGEDVAVSIPVSDIIFFNDENFVVVYKGDCDIEVRKLNILAKNSETVFISDGLLENEKVISKNQLLIFNRLNK